MSFTIKLQVNNTTWCLTSHSSPRWDAQHTRCILTPKERAQISLVMSPNQLLHKINIPSPSRENWLNLCAFVEYYNCSQKLCQNVSCNYLSVKMKSRCWAREELLKNIWWLFLQSLVGYFTTSVTGSESLNKAMSLNYLKPTVQT